MNILRLLVVSSMIFCGCSAEPTLQDENRAAPQDVAAQGETETKRAPNASVYAIDTLATNQDFDWTGIASDAQGDGTRPGRGDGRDLAYYYDVETDSLWFRFRLYDSIPQLPAISLALDTDLDQTTGTGWYGSVKDYTLDRLVSAGPRQRKPDGLYVGYNGITDAEGVQRRDWINVKEGVVALYLDRNEPAIVARISREDLAASADRLRILGSVGGGALWNDDIGEPAQLDFNEQ